MKFITSATGRTVLVVIFILVMSVAAGLMTVSDALYRYEACRAANFPTVFCWLPDAALQPLPMSEHAFTKAQHGS